MHMHISFDVEARPVGRVTPRSVEYLQIPVLESLLDKCDSILLGGGMIFTFYRAMGMSTGASMVEEDFVDMARDLIKKAEAKGVKLMLPTDVVVADKFAADAATQQVRADSRILGYAVAQLCDRWGPFNILFL